MSNLPPLNILSEFHMGRSIPMAYHIYDCKYERPVWEFERQGARLTFRNCIPRERRRPNGKRKPCSTFTYGARSRLMRFTAGIEWEKIPRSMFITLTYPDTVAHDDKDKRNKERYLFLRYVEKHLGRHICGLWRVEWKPRLSGSRQGETLPHIHIILFGVKYIPFDLLRCWWAKSIGTDQAPMVNAKTLHSGKGAVRYVAKYVAKVPEINVKLDDVTLVNSGRHYGYHRKRTIPLHLTLKFPIVDPKWVHYIRVKAGTRLKYLDLDYFETFTLVGDFAIQVAEVVEGNYLTGEYWHPNIPSCLGGEDPPEASGNITR